MAKEDKDLQLLLDVPEPEASFRFPEYARVLARAIVGSKPRLTIGIFGPWGKGKSTLLELVRKELDKYGEVVVVPFDAWRYQHETHMLLPMLDTLQQVLVAHKGVLRSVADTIGGLARALAYATKFKYGPLETSMKDAIGSAEEEAKSQYYKWHATLKKALEEARKGQTSARVVFLIDDLDRCLPGKAIEVVEAMKVMLDVEGFVFVVALDKSVLENAVEVHYGREYGIKGRDYIRKLVQVEFTLPPVRAEEV